MKTMLLVAAVALGALAPDALRAEESGQSPTGDDPGKPPTGDPGQPSTPAVVIVTEGTEKPTAAAGVVNVNLASIEELTRLPGIGPAKAQAIVAYRSKNKFVRKEQLLSVRGIGPKLLHQLRPYVVVEGSTTLRSKVKIKR